MTIQDIIFTAGQILMAFSILPSVFSKDKPALTTSLLLGIVLATFGVAYITLDLLFSAITAWIISVLWFVLAGQKYRSNKT